MKSYLGHIHSGTVTAMLVDLRPPPDFVHIPCVYTGPPVVTASPATPASHIYGPVYGPVGATGQKQACACMLEPTWTMFACSVPASACWCAILTERLDTTLNANVASWTPT